MNAYICGEVTNDGDKNRFITLDKTSADNWCMDDMEHRYYITIDYEETYERSYD